MATELKPKLMRAAVARGHTVMTGDPPQQVANGPGAVIELPEAEARHLMAAGFLQNPEAPPIPLGPGPVFGNEGNMISSPGDGR